ncbi:glutaredoxin-related family protein [Cavenderia fasciculata]|uniref:Glutaredoxin-related family protein n=1 Tax=Cavenderia fasciculata TaxID=261658 RepID=F4PWI7_CACFS|nr:glutaredoxin-related family protein [Cavenderia fasciculata]EGG20351.1 glutaredoxin-related family protein [Cavenderia fasciculata]|eukprot:XP_004367334.1 glutaredoxin-related family protein [Cavenderia fasciculata]
MKYEYDDDQKERVNMFNRLAATGKYISSNSSRLVNNNNTMMINNGRLSFQRYYSSITEDFKKKAQSQVDAAPCVLYMKGTPQNPQCGFSNTVVRILDTEGATFSSHNILIDDELRQGMKEFSDWPTFPQVYIKGEFVGGADIMISMFKSGELSNRIFNNIGRVLLHVLVVRKIP